MVSGVLGGIGFDLFLDLVEVIQDVAQAEDHLKMMLLDKRVARLMQASLSHVSLDLL